MDLNPEKTFTSALHLKHQVLDSINLKLQFQAFKIEGFKMTRTKNFECKDKNNSVRAHLIPSRFSERETVSNRGDNRISPML